MAPPDEILKFWFEDIEKSNWFKSTDAFDSLIRRNFENSCMQLAATLESSIPHQWEDNLESALALILSLDQFPRNMYRDTQAAYTWDTLALGVAKRLVAQNRDVLIPQERRTFIYMPYMHSESLEDQNRCVDLVDARLDDTSTLYHAKQHRDVIERFGRFPHRNKSLNRESTLDELAFLRDGGYAP